MEKPSKCSTANVPTTDTGTASGNDVDAGGNPVQVVPKPASAGVEDLRIGLRVQVFFEDISDDAGIPKFKPLTA